MDKEIKNGRKIVESGKTVFAKGHKKVGGKKLGWVSMKTEIRNLLHEMTNSSKDGKKITYKMALLNKLLHKAIIQGDAKAIQMIMEYSDGKPVQALEITEKPRPIYGGRSREN